MKFASKEDIEAPIEQVFAVLAEFEAYERSAIRRGAEVRRINDISPPRAGITWAASFNMRGKRRDVELELVDYDPPQAMRFEADSQGLDGVLDLELVALSPKRTRMAVSLDLTPKTLSARLFMQSLKLAKTTLTKRFKLKVADYAKAMEDRLIRSA